MYPTNIIALFCEGIREEKGGVFTLVGVQGDNVYFSLPPGPPPASEDGKKIFALAPKFSCYVRFSFDPDADLGPMKIWLVLPDGSRHLAGGVEGETVTAARTTKGQGNPLAGLISRVEIGGVPVPLEGGRIMLVVTIGEEERIAGTLNFLPESARPASIA